MAEAGLVVADRWALERERLAAELLAPDTGVGDEIAVARLILARVLVEVEDPLRAATALRDAGRVVAELRRLERVMDGSAADSLAAAANRILEELGYGG